MKKQGLSFFYIIIFCGYINSIVAIQNVPAPNLLIASASAFWGGQDWRNDAAMAELQAMMDYFKKMGYTHVTYNNEAPVAPIFCRDSRTGKWVYNNGNYNNGLHNEYLKNFKAHADSAGLKVIPVSLVSLSHQQFLNVFTMIFTMHGGGIGLCAPVPVVDNIRFVNRPGLNGDRNLEIRCRVTDLHASNSSATGIAGVMIRDAMKQNSAFVSIGLGTDNTVKVHARLRNGGAGKSVASAASLDAHPFLHIKYLRDSAKVVCSQGDRNGAMREIARIDVSFSGQCQFGFFSTAGDDRYSCDAQFEYLIYNNGTDYNNCTWIDGSWSDDIIGTDKNGSASSIISEFSEFHDPVTKAPAWSEFCKNCRAGQKCDPYFDHVAYLGDYVSGSDSLHNTQADEIFEEDMKIIKAVYGASSYPECISIGFDELGWGAVGYIKNRYGASYNLPYNASTLVAALIAFRITQIDKAFSSAKGKIKILLNGDSFVPGDYGEFYGDAATCLCGDVTTGKGGVLYKLKNDYGLGDRLYIAPWMFSWLDGDQRIRSMDDRPTCTQKYTPVPWDRIKQIKYLDALGINYLLGTGEDGKPGNVPNHLQCMFEWLRTAVTYPDHWAGSVHFTWEQLYHTNGSVYTGYSAPVLAYLTKYPYLALNCNSSIDGVTKYYAGIFNGVTFARSRTNKTWQYNSDYTTGLGLYEIGSSSKISGVWNDDFTQFALSGKSMPLGQTEDNFLYAYAVRDDDFECSVKVEPTGDVLQKGLMIRESLEPGSKYIHIHTNKSFPEIRIGRRYAINGTTSEDKSVLTRNFRYIKIVRQGTKTRWYAGRDGKKWIFIKEYAFSSGPVLIGMTHAGSGIFSSTALFSSFSLQ